MTGRTSEVIRMSVGSSSRFAAVLALSWGAAALAQNDFRIQSLGNPRLNREANAHFAAFSKSFGAALTSVNLSPPETVGHAAWALTAELAVVFLNGVTPTGDADGDGVPDNPLSANGQNFYIPTVAPEFNTRNPLLLPSLHFRKGLPFSFELGSRIAWIDKSSMFAASFEIKWAVNEGFAYLPDVGVRIHGNKLFNTRDFELGAGGLDIGVGKQFAVGGMVSLAPYFGWNLVFVGAQTRRPIEFDLDRPYAESVATVDAVSATTARYDAVNMFGPNSAHNRFYAGLRFIGGIVQIGAELSYSLLGQIPVELQSGTSANRALPGVGAANVTLGLDY